MSYSNTIANIGTCGCMLMEVIEQWFNLLKIKRNEPLTWEPKDADPNTMKIVPVNFGTEHRNLLSNLHLLATKGYFAFTDNQRISSNS
jgi:hypothetical protein